jgi:hypothetical protein
MTIAISCPRCHKQAAAPDQCAGQLGQCPYCGSAVPIPSGKPTWQVRLPNQQTIGPVYRQQIDEAVAAGRIPADALIWDGGPGKAVLAAVMYPQLRHDLEALQAPFSGQCLKAAVKPKSFLENLIFGPDLPRYKADKRQETHDQRQLIFITYCGIWAIVLICGTGLAGLQGGAESAIGAFLGYIFASLLPVGFGLLNLAAGLFEPEWLMNSWEGRRRRWVWGDYGARWTYMLPGFLMYIGGGLFACVMMAVGGVSGYVPSEPEDVPQIAEATGDFTFGTPYVEPGRRGSSGSSGDTASATNDGGVYVDPLGNQSSSSSSSEDTTQSSPTNDQFVEVPVGNASPGDPATYELRTREEAVRNAQAAYEQLRGQWDAAYAKSAELVNSTGGLASDRKGELRAADEAAIGIARTLAVAADSLRAAHQQLKEYCDAQSVFSEALSNYKDPPGEVPGQKEVERRSQVAKLALASGEEFVYLDAVTKVEQLERQCRQLLKSLNTAATISAEYDKAVNDLIEARKWAYQTRKSIDNRVGQKSPLLEIYPVDLESVALYGNNSELKTVGLSSVHAGRFKEAVRTFTMAKSEVERARARANKAEQAMAAYQARFGKAATPTDPVGQTYTAALKLFAAADKKLQDARTELEETAGKLGVRSSHLAPVDL